MTARSASHVLMIEPVQFRYNAETGESNVFQARPTPEQEAALARDAVLEHRTLRDRLIETGIRVTVERSRPDTPDACFCNNWFSTHPSGPDGQRTAVLYPMMAPNRRRERREDLIALLRATFPRVVDLTAAERDGRFLESTGSLCLDDATKTAYAAISPRTDRGLAETWAQTLGYRLVAFTARDAGGVPYYHTNVMMFIGHGLAGVCLESIDDPTERAAVHGRLTESGLDILPITRDQVNQFAGNCLPLTTDAGDAILVMSSAAWRGFRPEQRAQIERHARIVHSDLTWLERVGGGSARCLLAEVF